MRQLTIALACALAAALLAAAPAGAVLQSPNVTLQAKLPEAVSAIGARFSPDGDTMYVTGAKGPPSLRKTLGRERGRRRSEHRQRPHRQLHRRL